MAAETDAAFAFSLVKILSGSALASETDEAFALEGIPIYHRAPEHRVGIFGYRSRVGKFIAERTRTGKV
jgi:hypothetical protein